MKTISALVTSVAFALAASSASAQTNPRYIQFSPSATKGALYTPDSGAAPTIAFLTIDRTCPHRPCRVLTGIEILDDPLTPFAVGTTNACDF